jgi:cell division protein ZapE
MKPSQYYLQDVAAGKIVKDVTQTQALPYLDQLYAALEAAHAPKKFWLKRIFKTTSAPIHEPRGLYMWGAVGRGKTYLMDLLYTSLRIPKLRQHFYEFMGSVHAQLKTYQGQTDPLKAVAQALAQQVRILCLDEFFVEDIADAMILSSLLQYLFECGIILVTTSNVAPEDLYQQGLQRDRFLPAITLIQQNLNIIHLDHMQDYRMLTTLRDHRYHWPLINAEDFLAAQFQFLNQDHVLLSTSFEIHQRPFQAIKRSKTVLWIDFQDLCEAATGSQDYLALCQEYRALLLGNIPVLSINLEEAARRFIALVDTCYDQKVLLVLAAAVPLSELYQGTRLRFEFERVVSRIIEMQSWDYGTK